MDGFTGEIAGVAAMTAHSVALVLQALFAAVEHRARPVILHSDNGRKDGSKAFIRTLSDLGIIIPRKAKSSPWEKGYKKVFSL